MNLVRANFALGESRKRVEHENASIEFHFSRYVGDRMGTCAVCVRPVTLSITSFLFHLLFSANRNDHTARVYQYNTCAKCTSQHDKLMKTSSSFYSYSYHPHPSTCVCVWRTLPTSEHRAWNS